jgi:hypothetical protein
VEEEISRTVGAVMTQDGASTEDPDNDAMHCVFGIGNMSKRFIERVKVLVASPPRQISQVETEAQDLPPINTFQSQKTSFIGATRRPEQTMADWTGAVKGDAKTDDIESHPIGSNAISETILCRQDVPDQAFGRQVGIRYDARLC